jgi:hypothetical protein
MRHSTKAFGNTSSLYRIFGLGKQILPHHHGSQSPFEIFLILMPTKQFCTTKHPNFAFIQFYQRCVVVHVSNYHSLFTSCNMFAHGTNMCLVEIFSSAKRSSTLGARILLNSQPNRAISTPMVVRTNCGQLLPIG